MPVPITPARRPASAVIDGDELVVLSDKVADPKAVRYAFTSQAMPNLINQEGLPATPFQIAK